MTPEQSIIAHQVAQTIYSVQRDARLNAASSKEELKARVASEVADVHQQNAEAYKRLLASIDTSDPVISAAISAAGLDVSGLPAVQAAVDTYHDARKGNSAEIVAAADRLLADMPAVKDIWASR